MKIWKYLGEFFLFRWITGKLRAEENQTSAVKPTNRSSYKTVPEDYDNAISSKSRRRGKGKSHTTYGSDSYRSTHQSFDDLDEEPDDYDMMDDF